MQKLTNPHEESARAKKVAAFVAHFDAWIRDAGHDPVAHAELVAETLERMKPPMRIQHSIVCNQRAPSETTWAQVVAIYRKRATLRDAKPADVIEIDPCARCAS